MARMLPVFLTVAGLAAAVAIAVPPQPAAAYDDLAPGFKVRRVPAFPMPEPLTEEYCRREWISLDHIDIYTSGEPPAPPPYKHPFAIVTVAPPWPDMPGERFCGSVFLAFTVRSDGRTKDVRAVKSSHGIFEKPAIRAMEQWRWCPVFADGQPVETRNMELRFDFDHEDCH